VTEAGNQSGPVELTRPFLEPADQTIIRSYSSGSVRPSSDCTNAARLVGSVGGFYDIDVGSLKARSGRTLVRIMTAEP
jgi:hypothetical protein